MTSAHNVAAYILREKGTMTAMKLQKLVYYSQAWHLVWEDDQLFSDRIQAWVNGPVIYNLFTFHKGKYRVGAEDFAHGNADALEPQEIATVRSVLDFYGDMSASQLSELTHAESPWRQARGSAIDGQSSSALITVESMKSYYSHLSQSEDAVHSVEDINFPLWAR